MSWSVVRITKDGSTDAVSASSSAANVLRTTSLCDWETASIKWHLLAPRASVPILRKVAPRKAYPLSFSLEKAESEYSSITRSQVIELYTSGGGRWSSRVSAFNLLTCATVLGASRHPVPGLRHLSASFFIAWNASKMLGCSRWDSERKVLFGLSHQLIHLQACQPLKKRLSNVNSDKAPIFMAGCLTGYYLLGSSLCSGWEVHLIFCLWLLESSTRKWPRISKALEFIKIPFKRMTSAPCGLDTGSTKCQTYQKDTARSFSIGTWTTPTPCWFTWQTDNAKTFQRILGRRRLSLQPCNALCWAGISEWHLMISRRAC